MHSQQRMIRTRRDRCFEQNRRSIKISFTRQDRPLNRTTYICGRTLLNKLQSSPWFSLIHKPPARTKPPFHPTDGRRRQNRTSMVRLDQFRERTWLRLSKSSQRSSGTLARVAGFNRQCTCKSILAENVRGQCRHFLWDGRTGNPNLFILASIDGGVSRGSGEMILEWTFQVAIELNRRRSVQVIPLD